MGNQNKNKQLLNKKNKMMKSLAIFAAIMAQQDSNPGLHRLLSAVPTILTIDSHPRYVKIDYDPEFFEWNTTDQVYKRTLPDGTVIEKDSRFELYEDLEQSEIIDNPGVCTSCALRIKSRPAFWEAESLRATVQQELDLERSQANTLSDQIETQSDKKAALQWTT